MFKDSLFQKIENKTNINKETILELANKLKDNNMKDEKSIREVIQQLAVMTKKDVPKEKEDKIVNAILQDNVPKNIEKMF